MLATEDAGRHSSGRSCCSAIPGSQTPTQLQPVAGRYGPRAMTVLQATRASEDRRVHTCGWEPRGTSW